MSILENKHINRAVTLSFSPIGTKISKLTIKNTTYRAFFWQLYLGKICLENTGKEEKRLEL